MRHAKQKIVKHANKENIAFLSQDFAVLNSI